MATHDQGSSVADSSPCCSAETTTEFYRTLGEIPEPLFRRVLGVIGALGRMHPEAAWVCHRRLFLMVLDALSRAQSSHAATGT